MPLKYSSFLPSIGADGEVTPGTAVLAGVGRFGRSAVLRDVNINDIRDSSEGFATLLHTASNHGFSDVVTLLLEAGADPTKTDSVRFTPLHRVMRLGEVGYPVVDLLLCSTHELAGMKDLYGRTARDIAEEKSSEYDNTELQMLEMLKYSENIYYEKLQLAERKKNQVEAAAKSTLISCIVIFHNDLLTLLSFKVYQLTHSCTSWRKVERVFIITAAGSETIPRTAMRRM